MAANVLVGFQECGTECEVFNKAQTSKCLFAEGKLNSQVDKHAQ